MLHGSNKVGHFDFNPNKDSLSSEDSTTPKIIDFVLVYPAKDTENDTEKPKDKSSNEKKRQNRDVFLKNLKTSGLEVNEKEDGGKMFVLITTPYEKLLEVAEKTKLKLPIEVNDFENEIDYGRCVNKISSIFELPQEVTNSECCKYYTASYTSALHHKFEKYFNENKNERISAKDRCLLTYEVLSRTSYTRLMDENSPTFKGQSSDYKIGIDWLISNGTFQAAFCVHEALNKKLKLTVESLGSANTRQKLYTYWASGWKLFSYQPLDLIRNYFGEKLAFYFAWLGFYTSWLIIALVFGLLVLIYGIATIWFDKSVLDICNKNGLGNFTMCPLCTASYCEEWKLSETCLYTQLNYVIDNPATIAFSVIISIWGAFFVEFWKRKQCILQFRWDTEDFEKNLETIRPEFEQKVKTFKKNPITGLEEPYVQIREKIKKYLISYSMVLFMVLLALALLLGVITYRVILRTILYQSSRTREMSSTIISATAAVINLVIILILGRFYSWLAIKLTNLELHRTDSGYEDSLTIKMYLFQFVNNYASIFYIAFFKGRNLSNKIGEYDLQEQCELAGCMTELTIQLIIIMVGKQFFNAIQQIFYPLMRVKYKTLFKKKSLNLKPQYIKDLKLINWNSLTLFDEYLDMVIQYGFVALFTVAFPLGPLFSFLNNIIEIRIDAHKILTQYKRPLPKRAQSIGIWLPIINVISKLGVIINAFIIAFTSDLIPKFIYLFFYSDGSLDGYVKFTLSVRNFTEFNPQQTNFTEICYYKDYREPYDSPNKYALTNKFYVVLLGRLAFIAIFEHLVFLAVTILHILIPDVPKEIQDQIEREYYITQRAIWETDPQIYEKTRQAQSLINADDDTYSRPIDQIRSANDAYKQPNENNVRFNVNVHESHNDDDDVCFEKYERRFKRKKRKRSRPVQESV